MASMKFRRKIRPVYYNGNDESECYEVSIPKQVKQFLDSDHIDFVVDGTSVRMVPVVNV